MRPRQPSTSTRSLGLRPVSAHPPDTLPPLCFQLLPIIKFSNSFVLITMQIAPGVWRVGPILQFQFSSFQSAGARRASCYSQQSPGTNHQSLTPLECAVPRFRALTPLECAVTKTRPHNSFRMRSSEKKWGAGGVGVSGIQTGAIPDETDREDP